MIRLLSIDVGLWAINLANTEVPQRQARLGATKVQEDIEQGCLGFWKKMQGK
jgi:hypothetical protein